LTKKEADNLKKEELLAKVAKMFNDSASWDQPWRNNASVWYDYYHGNQWTSDEEAELIARGQAVTTYNHIKPAVDSIIGAERRNRPKITMAGRGLSDEKLASAKTKLYDYIQYNSRSDDEVDRMIRDAFVVGRGWISIFPTENSEKQTDIVHSFVDYRDMFTDPLSKRDDLTDARYVHMAIFTDADIIKAQFPSYKEEDSTGDIFGFEGSSENNLWYYKGDRNRPRLINTWLKDENGDLRTVIWVKGQILYEEYKPFSTNRYPFVQYTVERDLNNFPYGFVKSMLSGQDEVNKRHSKALHYLNSAQVLAEEDAFVDWSEAEKTLAKPNGVTKLAEGALANGKIKVVDNTQLANTHIQMMQLAKENIFYTAGLNPTFVGQSSQYESGTKANISITQAVNSIVPALNKLRITRYELAYVTMKLVPDYYTEARMVRVLEENGKFAFMPINQMTILDDDTIAKINDMSNDDVDIIIEEAPAGLSEREEQFAQLLQIQGQTSRPIPMEVLLRYSSIKDKYQLAEDIKQFYDMQTQLDQAGQQIQKMQESMKELDGQNKQLQNQLVQERTARQVEKEVQKAKEKSNGM
jgi:hypothetical protein